MVSGMYTDDVLASLYQSVDWTLHTIREISILALGAFWLLVPCMGKLHTRPALTWTAVSTIKTICVSFSGGKRLPGTTDQQYKFYIGYLWGDGRRCSGGLAGYRNGFSSGTEIPPRQPRIRRQLLQEGHPQSGQFFDEMLIIQYFVVTQKVGP